MANGEIIVGIQRIVVMRCNCCTYYMHHVYMYLHILRVEFYLDAEPKRIPFPIHGITSEGTCFVCIR